MSKLVIVSEWNPPRNPPREITDPAEILKLASEYDVMVVEKEGAEGTYYSVWLDDKGKRFKQR